MYFINQNYKLPRENDANQLNKNIKIGENNYIKNGYKLAVGMLKLKISLFSITSIFSACDIYFFKFYIIFESTILIYERKTQTSCKARFKWLLLVGVEMQSATVKS